jgi:uncharacterized protein
MPSDNLFSITEGPSKHGLGIHAARSIVKGESFYQYTGKTLTYHESLSLGSLESYPIQIGINKYLLADKPGVLINHSCQPNAGLTEDLLLVAIQNIEAGEEIFFDYSTSMMERSWEMPCACDTPSCRGTIQDFDLIPIKTQRLYTALGIVPSFVIDMAEVIKRATQLQK